MEFAMFSLSLPHDDKSVIRTVTSVDPVAYSFTFRYLWDMSDPFFSGYLRIFWF